MGHLPDDPSWLVVRRSGGNDGWLFGGKRLFPGACRDFPEIAVWISKVAAVSTIRCALRWLGNLAASAFGFGQHCIDALFGADDVGEREVLVTSAEFRSSLL